MDNFGYIKRQLNDDEINQFYSNKLTPLEEQKVENLYTIYTDENQNILNKLIYQNGKFSDVGFPTIQSDYAGTIKPRNVEQSLAFHMLNDSQSGIKALTGLYGSGKAQPISTVIPTPQGYKKLGDLQVGDYVFDRNGKPTKVLGIYPQGAIDNYKITFSDNRATYCNEEHIWTCYTSKGNFKNVTVNEMLQKGLRLPSGGYRYRIPLASAVQYDAQNFEIDPYVMGCFLGDGNCLEGALSLSSSDEELVATVAALIGAKNYYRNHELNFSWSFDFKEEDRYKYTIYGIKTAHRISTKAFFKHYPEVINYAKDKHIPKDYLMGSIEQRINLLQGLLDTDGTIDEKGRIRFTTTSYQLKEDTKQLVWSLGFLCGESIDHRVEGPHKHICYNLSISAPVDCKPLLFRLTRKKQLAIDNIEKRQVTHSTTLTIRNIEKMSAPEEMVCIYVDNGEHLYLTNDYIVTHNTFICVSAALAALQQGLFEKIVFIRNNVQVRDTDNLGALPGTVFDKTLEYIMPFADHCGGIEGLKMLVDRGQVEVIPLGFLRGRDIKNAIIYCTEAQNLTVDHMKLLIGRVGEGSQLWLDGDFHAQVDRNIFEKSSGLKAAVEKLSGNPLFAHVHLTKCERSSIAALADVLDE